MWSLRKVLEIERIGYLFFLTCRIQKLFGSYDSLSIPNLC